MKTTLILLGLIGAIQVALSTSAFPIRAQNFAEELFRSINKNIEWDPSNYLVDLSGPQAVCRNRGRSGTLIINARTRDGASVGGLVASTWGTAVDANSVTEYIKTLLRSWTVQSPFQDQILAATHFGCAVRPGCPGDRVVVACLFSPEYSAFPGDATEKPTTTSTAQPIRASSEGPVNVWAVAFTPEQYQRAEQITNAMWDRSHYLENLSGRETKCEMLTSANWSFTSAKGVAARAGINVQGFVGIRPNTGSTENALEDILLEWKPKFAEVKASITNGGCSLIPDCKLNSVMYVVVSCLIEV